ncbi:hypothetical protein FRC07_008025 [Ceratobasidium sp. 392]|nr:hypothetical protein FRC07_008025 [Ceratobasidium sp. 392]
MFLIRIATIAFSALKLFVYNAVHSDPTPALLGITAVDVGARLTHHAAYAALTRFPLQLPVGAFVPAPQPVGAADVAIYAGPVVAVAVRAQVVERLSKTVSAVRRLAPQVARAWHHQLIHYADLLAQLQPALTLESEQMGAMGYLEHSTAGNESSLYFSKPVYVTYPVLHPAFVPRPTLRRSALPLLLVPSTRPTLLPDMCTLPTLSACPVGSRALDIIVPRLITSLAVYIPPHAPALVASVPIPQPSPSSVGPQSFADFDGVASILRPDVCTLPTLSACPVGGRASGIIVPRLVTSLAIYIPPHAPALVTSVPVPQPSPSPVGPQSFADFDGVAVGFPVFTEPDVMIIYVRNCLFIGLPIVLCLSYICFVFLRFALRLFVRLARVVCDWVCAQCSTSARRLTGRLKVRMISYSKMGERIIADICGIMWSLVIVGRARRYSTPSEHIATVVPTVEVTVKVEEPAPVEATSAKAQKKRAAKKKAKAKAKRPNLYLADPRPRPAGEDTRPDRKSAVIDLSPEDDGGGWTLVARRRGRRSGGAYWLAPGGEEGRGWW